MKSEQDDLKSIVAIGLLQGVLFLGTVPLFPEIYAPAAKPQTSRSRSAIAN